MHKINNSCMTYTELRIYDVMFGASQQHIQHLLSPVSSLRFRRTYLSEQTSSILRVNALRTWQQDEQSTFINMQREHSKVVSPDCFGTFPTALIFSHRREPAQELQQQHSATRHHTSDPIVLFAHVAAHGRSHAQLLPAHRLTKSPSLQPRQYRGAVEIECWIKQVS